MVAGQSKPSVHLCAPLLRPGNRLERIPSRGPEAGVPRGVGPIRETAYGQLSYFQFARLQIEGLESHIQTHVKAAKHLESLYRGLGPLLWAKL